MIGGALFLSITGRMAMLLAVAALLIPGGVYLAFFSKDAVGPRGRRLKRIGWLGIAGGVLGALEALSEVAGGR